MDSTAVLKRSFIASIMLLIFFGFYVTQYSTLFVQSNGLNRYAESIAINIPTRGRNDSEIQPNTTISPHVGGVHIDLDVLVLTVDEMYDRLVLITAFSDNHYKEAMGYIGTAQKYMPGKRIIVYDLGLSNTNKRKRQESDEVRKLCDVKLRRFPFNNYPQHFKNLKTYAWKPVIINDMSETQIEMDDSQRILVFGEDPSQISILIDANIVLNNIRSFPYCAIVFYFALHYRPQFGIP
ncbi:uncharacterized protein [Apostichopus japonicus]|uniref:uncharacterized protein isoform X4 n=1 Tax=Stichopus japonicus TaxID=307972 RepID=UPI003AB75BDE